MVTVKDLKDKDNFFLMAGPCDRGGRYGIAYCREGSRHYE